MSEFGAGLPPNLLLTTTMGKGSYSFMLGSLSCHQLDYLSDKTELQVHMLKSSSYVF